MRPQYINLITVTVCLLVLSAVAIAQSTDAAFPTNVTTNEINGTIKARDIGDPRLTTFYYALGGGQGDLFINAVTANFSGDIDIFAAEGLRPLAKIVVFADTGSSETGRLIYLRKEEKLILRVQGRTPNDDPASFKIKFGGSFVALEPNNEVDAPKIAQAETNGSGVRVNSVGTIVEVIPKPTPIKKPVETVAEVRPKPSPSPSEVESPERPRVTVIESAPPTPAKPTKAKPGTTPAKKPSAGPPTVFGNKPKPAATKTTPRRETARTTAPRRATPKPARPAATKPAPPAEAVPDPLANIRLVVILKDGGSIERPMSEVQRFGVEKGVLTVVAKDGTIVRYQILDVAKVTIE